MGHSTRVPNVIVEEITYPEADYKSMRRGHSAPLEVVLPYQPVEAPAWSRHQAQHATKPARFERLQRWGKKTQCFEQITYGAITVTVLFVVVSSAIKFLH